MGPTLHLDTSSRTPTEDLRFKQRWPTTEAASTLAAETQTAMVEVAAKAHGARPSS